jgi:hypothetical protein
MITVNRNGSLLWDGKDDQAASGTKATIELPADLAMLDSRTIDGVIEMVFDRLGQCVIVLHVRVPNPLHFTQSDFFIRKPKKHLKL